MNKRLVSAFLLLALTEWSGGCTGPPELSSEMVARDSALTQDVKTLKKKQDQFATEAEGLAKETQTFRAQPGSNDLVPILKRMKTAPDQSAALKAWGDKYNQSGEAVARRYQELRERSAPIEQRRKDLMAEWAEIEKKERDLLTSSGRFDPRTINAVIAQQTLSYGINIVVLKGYGLDDLGLFSRLNK